MRLDRFSAVLAQLVLLVTAGSVSAGESPYGDHPRLGGAAGLLRSRITRHPAQEIQAPSVVTLKGGVRREAYFLSVYGERVVYYVKETDTSWLKEEVAREEIESIDFDEYLEKDPTLPRKIEPARKQPARKDDLLAGVFTARQGRRFEWTAIFSSEIDKALDFAEDATDYGVFELQSTFVDTASEDLPPELLPRGGGYNTLLGRREGRHFRAHSVKTRGRYFLFAPGAINNDEWVLVLSGGEQREVDRSGRETSLLVSQVPDEVFILYFSPSRRAFELAWSNVGTRNWSSPVGPRFERLARTGPGEGDADRPGGAAGSRSEPASDRAVEPPVSLPGAPRSQKRILAGELDRPDARLAQEDASNGSTRHVHPESPWRINGWRQPRYQLTSR